MIIPLDKPYPSILGAPVIDRVDSAIFSRRYFAHCMACGFCGDSCCQYGVDIDIENVGRIMDVADRLEPFAGSRRDQWFENGYEDDPYFPGGKVTRTQVKNGACVFLNRKGRGCLLHSFALQEGINPNDLKPLVSAIFPVTFDAGCLCPSDEILDNELICRDLGSCLYEGARADLGYYFGTEFVAVLDDLFPRYRLPSG
ncbi:MAG: hypothetical protein HYS17_03205 [Micavibrio aeruginosavorus]|uniref:YkgJ family cysteine cluster protein n=1 Tax=Micavibrio aeruginosavorus TaxID=349221 RepID=A0A7T5R3G9_9BACT|nr:MAG: hypothetical protein HYS17_03205 [Micavibrio aeruginosavorus]